MKEIELMFDGKFPEDIMDPFIGGHTKIMCPDVILRVYRMIRGEIALGIADDIIYQKLKSDVES